MLCQTSGRVQGQSPFAKSHSHWQYVYIHTVVVWLDQVTKQLCVVHKYKRTYETTPRGKHQLAARVLYNHHQHQTAHVHAKA